MPMDDREKIDMLLEHVTNVEKNTTLLGRRLIAKGEVALGVRLIQLGRIHDASKFGGIEYNQLLRENDNKDILALAISQHNTTNPHHPEYWGGIHNMPMKGLGRAYVAEMVCDWKARSNEMGTSLEKWITESATGKWAFTPRDPIYEEIIYFFNLLCEKPFVPVRPEDKT